MGATAVLLMAAATPPARKSLRKEMAWSAMFAPRRSRREGNAAAAQAERAGAPPRMGLMPGRAGRAPRRPIGQPAKGAGLTERWPRPRLSPRSPPRCGASVAAPRHPGRFGPAAPPARHPPASLGAARCSQLSLLQSHSQALSAFCRCQ